MNPEQLKAGKILRGPLFAEPLEVLVTVPMGDSVKLIGRGVRTSTVVHVILTEEKLNLLETSPDQEPFDGDAKMFWLGIEAMRLQLAFKYGPYFSLSIARVDPLPHPLEAVYDFWTLVQTLSTFYPAGADEKHLVDGFLARKKGLGF